MGVAAHRVAVAGLAGCLSVLRTLHPLLYNNFMNKQERLLNFSLENGLVVMAWYDELDGCRVDPSFRWLSIIHSFGGTS